MIMSDNTCYYLLRKYILHIQYFYPRDKKKEISRYFTIFNYPENYMIVNIDISTDISTDI